LEPDQAPVAVTRLLDLARSGYYDGISIHRAVPGFVVQVGERIGDGFATADRPPLRCETSPEPFMPMDLGMAIAGRDTGSAQFFVALGRYPQLDGDHTRVGHAEGAWAALAEGDRITKVTVEGP
jgi:cyclophilin family peptidyl-prolyl cis-trans isomerase